MSIEIQALKPQDIPRAMELKNSLAWNQTPEDWQRFLLLSPQGCFKALRGREVVATAAAFVFDRVCWIGMVIVQEGCRHQGVGRQIMARCLDYSAERGCNLVILDATRDGVSLYGRLGFRPEYLVGTSRGLISSGPGQMRGPEDRIIRRVAAQDLDAIVSLEACAQGAVREALLVQLVRQNQAGGFVCYGSSGHLDGFVLCRPGFHSRQVGPLIARDDTTAELVLQTALRDIAPEGEQVPVALTVPMNNPGMLRLIRKWGLTVEPRLTRMSKGRKRLHAREDMVYALSGPEKG